MQKLSSQSINTGVANRYFTGLTAAINVSGGTSTTSPVPTPASIMDRCRAAVPLWHAATLSVCKKCARSFSSFVIYAPPVDTHPCSKASSTYFFSFPSKLGIDSGINLLIRSKHLLTSCCPDTYQFQYAQNWEDTHAIF